MADNFNARLYARGYASSVTSRTATPPAQPNTCAPACVNCGLLECLCRPRFFAGQLLTEQDLNRLDAYIRAKNRMHNLQLHGWGVVNGLLVRCDGCGDGVVVGTGYAIDPCGEDIVVCGDTPVDICALIKRCQQLDVTCVPSSRTRGATTCDELEEDWVLAIRYNETQARAITALRSTPSCACRPKSSGCSCGGTCGCGCSTGKRMTSTAPTNPIAAAATQSPRSAPTECEATAICEGYAFDVFLAPTDLPRPNTTLTGGIIDVFRCCIEPLAAALPQPPGGQYGNYSQNPAAWTLWCCRMKEALIAFFSTGPQANCTLVARLQQYVCPTEAAANFDAQMQQAVDGMAILLLDAMFSCLCAALMPPAPCGTSDDCVPLAIVTVRKRDCRVLRVCNWTPLRKLVLTFPTLEYWFGWIPWFGALREAIARLCCTDVVRPEREPGTNLTNNVAGAAANTTARMMVNPALDNERITDNQTMTTLLMNAFARAGTPLDPATIVNGVFGVGAQSQQPLTATEKANITPFLLLQEVLRPVASSAVPVNLASEKPLQVAETVTNGGDETASLYTRVAALEKAIAAMGGKQS
jgi:hypothetical protein